MKASTALPGLYSPVEIDGRHYVDGVLLKTMHASVALDEGADLVLCGNPIVRSFIGRYDVCEACHNRAYPVIAVVRKLKRFGEVFTDLADGFYGHQETKPVIYLR